MILFQSDNGAEGATYEALPTMGADLMRVVNAYCTNVPFLCITPLHS